MKSRDEIIAWLLEGDVSIQYQTKRDLLRETGLEPLQNRISSEGWGKAFLERRQSSGHWGERFYQPKWISSHYTLLDLRLIESPSTPEITETLNLIFDTCRGNEQSINESQTLVNGDICVNGMFLNYASFFNCNESKLAPIVDYLLNYRMSDGGFNCQSMRSGAVHSSVHSTICVLEGFSTFEQQGYQYRKDEIEEVVSDAEEFLLMHRLFKSHRTGEVMNKQMTMLSFPGRWKFDVLRGLEYFYRSGHTYDSRMQDAIDVVLKKRRKDGTWPIQNKHPGEVHFDMEMAGKSSRINTLRALRTLEFLGVL